MSGRGQFRCLERFHDPSSIKHHDAIAKGGDEIDIVADQDQSHPPPSDEFIDQHQQLRLNRHIERRCRLVGDQQFGFGNEHHGDHHPLAHAARHFMRIKIEDALGSRMRTASSISSALRLASRADAPLCTL